MATTHSLSNSALLFALTIGFSATTFFGGSKANTEVSVSVHSKVGARPCELVQRGLLVIAKQYAWVQIEGQKSETYSPELGPSDYLSASAPISGGVAKDVHKSGFELRAEPQTLADLPKVRALQGDAPCTNLQDAITEVEQAREHRRTELQGKLYTAGANDVVPAIALKETIETPKPDQSATPNTSSHGKSAKPRETFRGTVGLLVLIDIEGKAKQSKVVRSLNPELDKKAAEEVARWKFAPARRKGLPVPSVIPIDITFDLH